MTEEEKAFDKVKKGVKEVVGGTAGVVEGTAQGIKEAVEDTKEGVEDAGEGVEETAREATDTDMHTSSYEETKNREYNEAVANKVEDPDKDLDSEYQKEKTEERMD